MLTREELQGKWQEVKGRLQEHWGQLTDEDLQRARGTTEELIGAIQKKTGATRREIEVLLTNAIDEGAGVSEQFSDAAQHYAAQAARTARENYSRGAVATEELGRQLGQRVRSRPGEALAIAFGLGIAAGACLFLRRRR